MVPVSSDTRAPWTMRLNTERPYSSVPNQCSAEGGCSRWRRFCSAGGWSAISGAKSATSTRSTMIASPSTAMRLRRKRRTGGAVSRLVRAGRLTVTSAIADPGVQQGVGQVYQQVDEDEHHRDEQHRALDQRAVLSADRIDDEPADARPGEYGFGEYGTTEQTAELEAHHRDDRQHRVAQRVAHVDRHFRRPLGAGGTHIIGAQHLDHAA